MNKKRAVLLLFAICAVVGAWAMITLIQTKREASILLYDSALNTLEFDTHEALRLYYTEHGRYPESLNGLHYPKHSDEYCPSMLKDLSYTSEDTNYTLKQGTDRHGLAEYLEWRRNTY